MTKRKTCEGCHDWIDQLDHYKCRHYSNLYSAEFLNENGPPDRCEFWHKPEKGNCVICRKPNCTIFSDFGDGPYCNKCWLNETSGDIQ